MFMSNQVIREVTHTKCKEAGASINKNEKKFKQIEPFPTDNYLINFVKSIKYWEACTKSATYSNYKYDMSLIKNVKCVLVINNFINIIF